MSLCRNEIATSRKLHKVVKNGRRVVWRHEKTPNGRCFYLQYAGNIYLISVLFDQTAASRLDVTALCLHLVVLGCSSWRWYITVKIHGRNLVLYIFRAVLLHAQVCLRLTAQLPLSLLHVSAENHSHLQGATHLYTVYLLVMCTPLI